LKEIKNYLYKNGVYIWKEARKLIINSLLGVIHKLTLLKWPTNDLTDDPTNSPIDSPTDGPIDSFTNDLTLALLLLSTAPV
jgi:hypothetical protein